MLLGVGTKDSKFVITSLSEKTSFTPNQLEEEITMLKIFEHKRGRGRGRGRESSMESQSKTTMTTTTTTILLTKIITTIYKFLLNLTHNHKSLQILYHLLSLSFSWILFFLHLLPSLYSTPPNSLTRKHKKQREIKSKGVEVIGIGESSIGRALSQILSLINEIPITSRKYELVRSLAETLIEENLKQDFEFLRDVNRKALSSAFQKALIQLEAAMIEEEEEEIMMNRNQTAGPFDYRLNRFFKTVRSFGGPGKIISRPVGSTAEKFAIELLWLAQKLTACGSAEVSVSKWGSASNLAWLSLSAEPRLQGFILKISAFLFKQAKEMGEEAKEEGQGEKTKGDEEKQKKMMNILMTWLPFLCQASNGSDAPMLNNNERMDLERVLENIIEMLKHEDEQEQVLALWLHHFTSCPLSDWPNLQSCYARWCDASRKRLTIRQQP